MTLAARSLLFLTLLMQGCYEKFVVTETVYIGMGECKLACIDLKGQKIGRVTDFWIHGDCLYGYRYRNSEYGLFLIDLKANRLFEGMEAQRIVCKEGMPLDRWTNAVELFGDYVSDRGRRNSFVKVVREAGLSMETDGTKGIRK